MPERLLCFGTLAGLIPAAGSRLSRLPPHEYKTVSFPCNHGPVLKCTPRPSLLPGQANKVGIEIAFCAGQFIFLRRGERGHLEEGNSDGIHRAVRSGGKSCLQRMHEEIQIDQEKPNAKQTLHEHEANNNFRADQ